MSMTAEEKNAIRTTWDLVKKDLPGNGTDLFVRYVHVYIFTVLRVHPFMFLNFLNIFELNFK